MNNDINRQEMYNGRGSEKKKRKEDLAASEYASRCERTEECNNNVSLKNLFFIKKIFGGGSGGGGGGFEEKRVRTKNRRKKNLFFFLFFFGKKKIVSLSVGS